MTEDSIDLDRCIWDSDYRQAVKRRLNAPGPEAGEFLRARLRIKLARFWMGFSRRLHETT